MSSRCSSAPKMQRVWTPRVKDGRRSNEDAKVQYYGKTAGSFKFDANANYLIKYRSNQVVLRVPAKTSRPNSSNRKSRTRSTKSSLLRLSKRNLAGRAK